MLRGTSESAGVIEMSDSTAFSFDQLPLEILHVIFRYLDVPDILRIRRVSRYINEISHNREVWSDAYRKAEFVRPPGPFLWQSTRDLEDTLVPSFRIDRNLRDGGGTSQMERPTLKLKEIRYTGVDLGVNLVFGRFLVIAFHTEIRCYDLKLDAFDSNSGASIIYRSTGGNLRSFHCVSAIDVQGHPFACAVLREVLGTMEQLSIYSLNVEEESEMTLNLLHQSEYVFFDINAVDLGPRMILVLGRGPDPAGGFNWNVVALDVHTCTQFLLSSFNHAEWEDAPELLPWHTIQEFTSPICISTSTHLLWAMSLYTRADGWSTLLQAFALPPPRTHHTFSPTSEPLYLTHRGSIPGINMSDAILLHDIIIDLTTQDALIAIRVHAYEPSRPRNPLSKHGILRLSTTSKPHSHDSGVGTITFQLLGFLGQHSWAPFLYPSFTGTGRIFYALKAGSCTVSALDYDLHMGNGSDEEHGAKVTEYPSILRFSTPRTLLDYDPYLGRMCLQSAMAKYNVIEILDLAV